jgi:hypothetical protein
MDEFSKCPRCGLADVRRTSCRCGYPGVGAPPNEGAGPSFFVKFLFGFVGAGIGLAVGFLITGDNLGGSHSLGTSLSGGIGCALGFAIATALFGKKQ